MRANYILFSSLVVAASSAFATPETWQFTLTSNEKPIHLQSKFPDTTILETLERDGRFEKLLDLISEHQDLKDELGGEEKMTLLAPTDKAMRKIPCRDPCDPEKKGGKNHIIKHKQHEPEQMEEFIKYHIIPEELDLKTLHRMRTIKSSMTLDTLNGVHQKHRVKHFGDKTFIDFAMVEEQMKTKNGVILVIDRPLIPPPKTASVMFQLSPFVYSTTLAAIYHAGLDKELDEAKGITMFAPTNMAWKSLDMNKLLYLFSPFGKNALKKVLLTHIVPQLNYGSDMAGINKGHRKWLKTMNEEEGIEVSTVRPGDHPRLSVNNESLVICADGPTANGVVHAINYPIIPSNVKWRTHAADIPLGNGGLADIVSFQ